VSEGEGAGESALGGGGGVDGAVMGVEAAEFSPALARAEVGVSPYSREAEDGVSRWRFSFPCQRLRLWDCPLPGQPAEIPRRAAAPPS
jgi:hypothetical protein